MISLAIASAGVPSGAANVNVTSFPLPLLLPLLQAVRSPIDKTSATSNITAVSFFFIFLLLFGLIYINARERGFYENVFDFA